MAGVQAGAQGNLVTSRTCGLIGPVARGEVYYRFDLLGDVALRHTLANDELSADVYDAWGLRLAGAEDVWGYRAQAGYEWDAETGLYLLTWRWYDPCTGRFVTRDPIGYAGGLNLYTYCGNNPVSHVDPLGLAPCCGSSSRLGRWLRGAWENLRDLASVRRWMPHVAWGEIGWDMGAGANAGLFGLFGGGDAAREQIGPEAFKVSKRASGVAMVSGGAAVMGYVTAEREVVKAMMGRPTAAAEALRARTEPIRAEVFRWGMNAEFAPQKRAALVKIGPHVHMWPNTKAHLYPGRYAQVRGWIEPLRNDLRAAAKKYPDIAVQRGQVHLP